MNTENINPSILSKIRKLLALAEKSTNVEEAANAQAKIRDMLLKYNLELHQIQKDEKKEAEDVSQQVFNTEALTGRHEGGWVRSLADVIAKYNMCFVIGTGKKVGHIYIIGTKTNVDIVWFLVEQLVNRLRPMSKEAFSKYEGNEKRNTFIRGYLVGAVSGIKAKLAEEVAREVFNAKEAATRRANQQALTEGESTALALTSMLTKETKRVQDFVQQNFSIKMSAPRTTSSVGGRQVGYSEGKSMQINKGLS